MPRVQKQFGVIGNDVGRGAALGHDVVNSRRAGNVLAQVLHRGGHDHQAIQRRPPLLRRRCRVRGQTVKFEFRRDHRQHAVARCDRIRIARMPVQDRIHVAKQSGPDHVHFAGTAFLGRSAVIPHRAGKMMRRQIVLDRDRSQRAARAQQVVTAAVTRRAGPYRLPLRHGVLREPRQRIEFAQDSDHRLALPPAGDERRWHLRHARLHLEARRCQRLLKQRRALLFLVSHLREFPNLPRHLPVLRRVCLHQANHLRVSRVRRPGREWRRRAGKENCQFRSHTRIHYAPGPPAVKPQNMPGLPARHSPRGFRSPRSCNAISHLDALGVY
jgi:hypothetical protein